MGGIPGRGLSLGKGQRLEREQREVGLCELHDACGHGGPRQVLEEVRTLSIANLPAPFSQIWR